MKAYWFVGHTGVELKAFKASKTPTTETHGSQFSAIVGPFNTKRGALWAERYGYKNPHFRHVADAERLAKIFQK